MEVADKNGKSLREAFDKIREIANKNNATMDDIVKITIYLADPASDYPHLRSIVSEYFTNPSDIARSVVGVSRIPDNDSVNFDINRRVEIDAVIVVKVKH
jgi:enamine deaminase RidA (YjgF/YER057c/UK114 family)